MGGKKSLLKGVDLKKLSEETRFSSEELKDFYAHYRTMRNGYDRTAFRNQWLKALGVRGTFFSDKVFEIFDQDHDNEVQFADFVKTFSILARGTIEERIQLVFGVYSRRGFITRESFAAVVSAMLEGVGAVPDEDTVNNTVERFFQNMNPKENDRISFGEYHEFAVLNPKLGATLGGIFWSIKGSVARNI